MPSEDNELAALRAELDETVLGVKAEHDAFVKMGALGVSPSQMTMYSDAVKKIKEFEKTYLEER